MSRHVFTLRRAVAGAVAVAATVALSISWAQADPPVNDSAAKPATPGTAKAALAPPTQKTLPTPGANVDYQIGGPYDLPAGVTVVSRDRTAPPATETRDAGGAKPYNICYVNAFQIQPGERADWRADLQLKDRKGALVIDRGWGEPLLDFRTPDQQRRVAAKINQWISGCAEAGFDAVELDNYDSFTRSNPGGNEDDERGRLLTPAHAKALMKLLVDHAHSRNLAVAQKNTVELAPDRRRLGLDFAIVEECGEQVPEDDEKQECEQYLDEFGDNVILIEYTDAGKEVACKHADRVSVVRRDRGVVRPGESSDDGPYVRQTC